MQNSIELTLHMQCSYICLDFFILILARNHEEKWESTQKSPERKSQIYCIVPCASVWWGPVVELYLLLDVGTSFLLYFIHIAENVVVQCLMLIYFFSYIIVSSTCLLHAHLPEYVHTQWQRRWSVLHQFR